MSEQESLQRKYQQRTADCLESSLNQAASQIDNRLKTASARQKEIEAVLLSLIQDIKSTPAGISTSDAEARRAQASLAVTTYQQMGRHYQAKQQEIELLRLHNRLQAETPRRKATAENRAQARQTINQMVKLSDEIFTTLKDVNISATDLEKMWLARMLQVRETLVKLRNGLASHITDLALAGRKQDTAPLPPEIVTGLNYLGTYLTHEDFTEEYRMLQAKYGNTVS